MLETSRVQQQLADARVHADAVGLRDDLEMRLAYLDRYAEPKTTRCVLFPDAAPFSFRFVMERELGNGSWMAWFEGGLLYHGAHDRYGAGAAPTLAVTLQPTLGWQIHT